jgi:hypothetical protein
MVQGHAGEQTGDCNEKSAPAEKRRSVEQGSQKPRDEPSAISNGR